jgi:hypothetical protein
VLKRTLLVLSSVVLPCVFAAPALAVPPTTEVFEVEVGDFTDVNTELCGFPITFDESGTYKVKTFYDAQGNPVRSILSNFNARYNATATANGKTLSTNYPLAVITSFEKDLRLELGLRNAYRVPGAGVVLLDAGRVIIDRATGDVLFEAGQHQFLEGDADAFCNYFADP